MSNTSLSQQQQLDTSPGAQLDALPQRQQLRGLAGMNLEGQKQELRPTEGGNLETQKQALRPPQEDQGTSRVDDPRALATLARTPLLSSEGAPTGATLEANTPLEFLEHRGELIKVKGDQEGWIRADATNFDPDDPYWKSLSLERSSVTLTQTYFEDLDAVQDSFYADCREKVLKEKPEAASWDELKMTQYIGDHYTEGARFEQRMAEEKELIRSLARDFVETFTANYALDDIFDVADLDADRERDDKDRQLKKSDFGGEDARVVMGKALSKDAQPEELFEAGDWIATMEVCIKNPEKAKSEEFVINQIVLNLPMMNFINREHERGTDYEKDAEYYRQKINLLAIMMAHELIHANQNTRLVHEDLDNTTKHGQTAKNHKALREILAYHFTAFPNMVYADPAEDPVFNTTDFARGVSTQFGALPDLEQAFIVWKGLDYYNMLQDPPAEVVAKYKLGALKEDFLSEARRLTDTLGIGFDAEHPEFARFCKEHAGSDPQRRFMAYLKAKYDAFVKGGSYALYPEGR